MPTKRWNPRPTPTAESPEAAPWQRECHGRGGTRHNKLRAYLDVTLGPGWLER
jgi:hypothetical protein